ncbi:MAG: DUF3343 domain-containing protein [Eubacterium sp.]|nr:DUF3343 domain-containing protein [Eubacterium sp.]
MTFIATFFAHIGALRFKKMCDGEGIEARTMPVPRSLSSSCGMCVEFKCDAPLEKDKYTAEVETVSLVTAEGYKEIYRADGI